MKEQQVFVVAKVNRYNPCRGLFYIDANGTPTKERHGEILFSGSENDCWDFWVVNNDGTEMFHVKH